MKVTQDDCWDRACEECGVIVNGEKLCKRCFELLTLRVTVRDLKARLRSIRKHSFSPAVMDARASIQIEADLRLKNWRKP